MNQPNAIRTARVPQRLAGSTQLRPGLEQWLGGCDPAQHGLPRDAVVLVRRLRTRWSTVLCPDTTQRYAPLLAVMAGARRAATADTSADAVWFANEAELLACMARDALADRLSGRWWWRTLQHGPPVRLGAEPALARWLENPKHMPRALQWLDPATALAWLRRVGENGRAQIVDGLAQVFCLAPQTPSWVLEGLWPGLAGSPPHACSQVLAPDLDIQPGSAARTAQAATQTQGAAERLQALCTALAADAAAASSPARLQRLATASRPWPGPASGPGPLATADPSGAETPHAAEADSLMQQASARPVEGPKAAADTVARASPEFTHAVPRAKPVATDPAHTRHAAPHAQAATRTPALDAARPEREAETLAANHAPTQLRTRHGGLLFLLNAALQLQLYGDFTQPRFQGLDCPPWRFLLLAGRAWCGPGFRRDPLHGWLLRRAAGALQPVPLALWPRLHARLAQALDAVPAPRPALRQMLGLAATVHHTGERLEVFFSLAQLPLAVRLSGLDRDPGWIPVAGCDVRFHFD